MAFVHGYKNDVFISYAHADNRCATNAKEGWVTTFGQNLNDRLARKLTGDASIWMDHRELTGNAPLTPVIMNALRETATLVVVVSPRYLSSEWCRREREAFFDLISQRTASGSRVFRVEMDKMDELPDEFKDTLGYPFWVEDGYDKIPRTLGFPDLDSSDQEYYNRLNRISHHLAQELKRAHLANAPNIQLQSTRHTPTKATVFLAEVTDDLDLKREEVKDYLDQAGFNVLPETWRSYEDFPAFKLALDRDLKQCEIFVQLLSDVPGRRPFNQRYGYPRLQYEQARSAGKKILQWRSDKLKMESASDSDQLALIDGPTVRAEGIEEFKRAVIAAAMTSVTSQLPANGKFVFVSADTPDRSRAEELIGQLLKQRGISYAMLPPTQSDPEKVRKFIEVSLSNCDAALVIYCATDQASVLGQVLQCRKILAQRDQPVPAIAVYDGPPPPDVRDEISFGFPNLHFLNCRRDQTALEKFLDGL